MCAESSPSQNAASDPASGATGAGEPIDYGWFDAVARYASVAPETLVEAALADD